MKTYDSSVVTDHAAGRVDSIDAITFVLDSGIFNFAIGIRGSFTWTDDVIGTKTFYGTGLLMSLDVPENALGPEATAITVRLRETYIPEGSDVPVNVFDNGTIASIDEEVWDGRQAILSIFWLDAAGMIIDREQVAVREVNEFYMEEDSDGNPVRVAVLEEPDITQRDVEGRTANKQSQKLIDATDKSFRKIGEAKTQEIHFGYRPKDAVKKKKS